ncbi:hypothetical protein CN318_22190 [Bacillus cereus]|nr:hypothetical protein CN318_22190 [Bacillus cereus]
MDKLMLYSVFLFSFFLIIGSKFNNIYIYGSSFMCFMYIMYIFLNIIKIKYIKISITKRELMMVSLLIIYMIFTSILGLYIGIENKSIYKVIFNNLYIFTFVIMLIYPLWNNNFSVKFANVFGYSFIFIGLIGLLMYVLGIYAVRISFNPPFFNPYDKTAMLNFFGEIRFQSIFSHKTKYAFYCLIGIFILRINPTFSIKMKFFGIIILVVNIILTNSIMSLIALSILMISFVDYKKINKYFRYIIFLIISLVISMCGIIIYNYTSNVRNLDTWGSRKYIWDNALEFFGENPIGVIDNWYLYKIGDSFQGAHNVFLNELLDYGITGGILFLLIYLLLFYNLFRIDKRTLGLFLAVTTIFMIDNVLYYDMVPVFWFLYVVIKIILDGKKTLSDLGEEIKGD